MPDTALRQQLLPVLLSTEGLVDTVAVWAWRTLRWHPVLRQYGAQFHCGFDDPVAIAAWHPRLEFID